MSEQRASPLCRQDSLTAEIKSYAVNGANGRKLSEQTILLDGVVQTKNPARLSLTMVSKSIRRQSDGAYKQATEVEQHVFAGLEPCISSLCDAGLVVLDVNIRRQGIRFGTITGRDYPAYSSAYILTGMLHIRQLMVLSPATSAHVPHAYQKRSERSK